MTKKKMLETAHKLYELCSAGKEEEALKTLYHRDAVSVEAMAMEGEPSAEMKGVKAIKEKHAWWNSVFDVRDAKVDGPFPHGDDRFGMIFEVDAVNKETGERTQMKELAVYHVNKNGKIVREEFFYGM